MEKVSGDITYRGMSVYVVVAKISSSNSCDLGTNLILTDLKEFVMSLIIF